MCGSIELNQSRMYILRRVKIDREIIGNNSTTFIYPGEIE